MADDRLRVGIVGCGGITRALYSRVYPLVSDIAQVVAVADLDASLAGHIQGAFRDTYYAEAYRNRQLAVDARTAQERQGFLEKGDMAESAAKYPIRRYSDHEELLGDDEVQVMCAFTPPPVRAAPAVAAAESGRHVFTEGPMARSVEEADAIYNAVKKAGVKYDCQVLDRFPRDMVLARRAVATGALGRMGFANVELNSYLPQGYYRQTPLQHRTWRGTWQGEGGGAAFHHGRYIIDPFLSVVGSPVVQVFAHSGPMLRKIEHDSLSQAVVKFANGATGIIHASLITHTSSEMRERTSVGNRGSISVAGYDAAMTVHNENLARGAEGLPVMTSTTEFTSSDNPGALESLEAMRQRRCPPARPHKSGASDTQLPRGDHQRLRDGGPHRGAASPRRGDQGHLQVLRGEPAGRPAAGQGRPLVPLRRPLRRRPATPTLASHAKIHSHLTAPPMPVGSL